MTESVDTDEKFVGWARCFHIADDTERSAAMPGYLTGLSVEALLWRIGMLSAGTIELDSDQWVRVVVDGKLFPEGKPVVSYMTSIQGDTFELALTETYRRWLARHDVVCGIEDRPWEGDDAR